MSKPRCNQCKMRATCELQFNKIVERRPEKPNGHSGGCVYFGVLSCDKFCDTTCLSDIVDGKVDSVVITTQHAHSLAAMVQWFRQLADKGMMMQEPGRSDGLTVGYCDELLEELGAVCSRCKGDGQWHSETGFAKVNPIVKCPMCGGTGRGVG